MNSNSLPSQRQIRYGEVIRGIISEVLSKDFVLNGENDLGIVTVSFVRMSKDLRIASIYIMPLGGKNKNQILDILNENKFFFQKAISVAKLKSKFTPKINFFLDDSFLTSDSNDFISRGDKNRYAPRGSPVKFKFPK